MKSVVCAAVGLVLAAQGGLAAGNDALDAARALAVEGRQGDALRAIDGVLSKDPNSAEAQFLKGFVLARAGREDEAQQIFLELTRRYPNYPEPFNNLAVLYAQRGEYERAVEILKQALQTHSSYGAAYENLTKVYGKLASRAYDRALGQESSTPSAGPGLQLLADFDSDASTRPGAQVTLPARDLREAPPAAPAEPLPVAPRAREPEPVAPAEPIAEFDAAAVVATVEAWARAWSDQRPEDYLGFYSQDFVPEDGSSRAAWRETRIDRIRGPRLIEVTLDGIAVRQVGQDAAQARFNQSYRSDRFQDRVVKTMDLVREGGEWKIRAERTGSN